MVIWLTNRVSTIRDTNLNSEKKKEKKFKLSKNHKQLVKKNEDIKDINDIIQFPFPSEHKGG